MTTVLESMARAIARLNIAEQRNDRTWGVSTLDEDVEGAWPDYIPEARAALIALRDGVDDNAFMAAWPDSRPGRPAMQLGQKRFKAVLDAVLQEGEKGVDSGKPTG